MARRLCIFGLYGAIQMLLLLLLLLFLKNTTTATATVVVVVVAAATTTIYIFVHQVMVAWKKSTYIRTKINNKQIPKQN